MIVCDPYNPRATALKTALLAALPEGVPDDELAVVIGGDGYFLKSVHRHGLDRTYLGLNAGTLGFLLNDVPAAIDEVAERLRHRRYAAHAFPMLHGEAVTGDGVTHPLVAINDIYLERMTGQTARLALSIDGTRVVEALVADGLIFSTALGSTGYSFSAGGTACHPTLQTLGVTPICPHHPRLAPMLLPRGARARVDVAAAERRPVRAVADGDQLDDVRTLEVRLGDNALRIAYFDGHDFTGRMVRKLLHP